MSSMKLLLSLLLSTVLSVAQAGTITIGQTVQLPKLQLLDNTTVDLQKNTGKLKFIEFWATWCPYCARQNPEVNKLFTNNKHQLEVYAISIDRDKSTVVDHVEINDFEFKVAMLDDNWRKIFKQFNAVPVLIVLSPSNKVLDIWKGQIQLIEIPDLLIRYQGKQ